ncbi:MAG: S-methyl-5'-thioadenosine phosphorylase [Candidatus Gygaella obscura]|nr:S-methyl-5'-thioadenosine phosphorylase [Candidatus Gygaella obscura]
MIKVGIIGGSGIYDIDGLDNIKEVEVNTPFGKPSDKFITGNLEGKDIVFLPRHGRGHLVSPTNINYRANIFAMKKLGVECIISVTACGSLKEELKPMDFVVVDQFVDRTNHSREMSFFDNGIVAHIMFAHPVCKSLSELIYKSGKDLGIDMHEKGTYINMEGPAFSTLAESKLYRSWGMDIIGMTNMPEAKLAREAEICYATLAAVTDYDCWHPEHDNVTTEMVINNLIKNIENAKKILKQVIKSMPETRVCVCKDSLQNAIITDKKKIPESVKNDLSILIGKYL